MFRWNRPKNAWLLIEFSRRKQHFSFRLTENKQMDGWMVPECYRRTGKRKTMEKYPICSKGCSSIRWKFLILEFDENMLFSIPVFRLIFIINRSDLMKMKQRFLEKNHVFRFFFKIQEFSDKILKVSSKESSQFSPYKLTKKLSFTAENAWFRFLSEN